MSTDHATQAAAEIAACPTDLPGTARQRAARADRDAKTFAHEIRELDPHQMWGRLALMPRDRLMALVVSLAAGWHPQGGRNLDWSRRFGGTAALHPDYDDGRVKPLRVCEATPRDKQIIDLFETGLSRGEVARRVGVSYSLVQKVIAAAQPQQEEAA